MWSEERKEGTTKQAIDFEQNGSVVAFLVAKKMSLSVNLVR